MADDFYPFVDSGDAVTSNHHITSAQRTPFAQANTAESETVGTMGAQGSADSHADGNAVESTMANAPQAELVQYPARIAVYDDMLSTPRVIVIEPKDIRSYLEEITNTVNACVKEQGGKIPFMVIREIVENFIHAYFIEPTVSVLDGGNTLRFADQGPGIANKRLALEAGMTSADEHMKRYIRGVGSGFPTVQQYLEMAGGRLTIEDNMNKGTVVTVTLEAERAVAAGAMGAATPEATGFGTGFETGGAGAPGQPATPPIPSGNPYAAYPQQPGGQAAAAGQPYPFGYPAYPGAYPPAGYPTQAGGYPGYGGGSPNPWVNQQGYGFPQSFPQSSAMFSTSPQPAVSPYDGSAAGTGGEMPYVSERGHLALGFMAQNGSCGPTDLARSFGSSNPTWSRELATLAETGLVIKRGQKYLLTKLGETLVSTGGAS